MPHRPRTEMNWVWILGAPLVRAILALSFRVRIEGLDRVPARGPVVLAPNHVSVLDGPGLSAITGAHRRRATRNLIAAEVFSGVLGWILRQARQIPIRRGTGDIAALDDAISCLSRGSCVGIFPEGKVNDDPEAGPQRIRSGLTRIALPVGAPVIPIAIWGTQTVWPHEGLRPRALLRRPPLVVVYGEPLIPAPGGSAGDFRERFSAALGATVERARSLAGEASEPDRGHRRPA